MKNKTNKCCAAIVLVLLMALCLGGCGEVIESAVDSGFGTVIDADDIQREQSIHIRDKDLLYENQDNTEIVTMYLTVSMGNSAENTDHP